MREKAILFRRIYQLGALYAGMLASGDRVLGDPITFYFTGTVNFVHDYLDLDKSVYVGAPFSGSYTFDPIGVTDDYPDHPNVGFYDFGPAGSMSARIGNYDFVTFDLGILIWNDLLGEDAYEPISTTPFEAAGYEWSIMRVILDDRTASALDSDALPTEVPDLADFPTFAGLVLHLPGDDVGIFGRLTSLTPEPGSMALVGFGGALLLARRRSR